MARTKHLTLRIDRETDDQLKHLIGLPDCPFNTMSELQRECFNKGLESLMEAVLNGSK